MADQTVQLNISESKSIPSRNTIEALIAAAEECISSNRDKAAELIVQARFAAKQHGCKDLLAQSLRLASSIANARGDYSHALTDATNALTLFELLDDKNGARIMFEMLGSIYTNLSDYKAAIDMFKQCLSIARDNGDARKEAALLKQIGNIYFKTSDYHSSLDFYKKNVDVIRRLKDVPGEAAILNNIGIVYLHLGDCEKALQYLNESLRIKQQLGDLISEASTHNNIGLVYERMGRYPKALECYQKSLPLTQSAGDEYGQAGILINIGVVYQQIGDYSKALDQFLKSLDITRRLGDQHGETEILNNIGTVCLETGDYSSALEYLKKSLKIWQDIDDKHGEAVTLKSIGGVYFKLEKFNAALGCYSKILPIAEEAGDSLTVANTLNDIGDVHRTLGNAREALENYERCLKISKKSGFRKCQAEALLGIGIVHARGDYSAEALESLHEALALSEELGAKDHIYKAHYNLSFAYESQGNIQEALNHMRAFHRVRETLFNEESDKTFKKLQAIHEVETAKHEAEIYRLRTVELVELNRNLNEAITEKNELMSIAAHDLKNPLTAILMATSLFNKADLVIPPAKVFEHVKRIDTSAERMLSIITQLLSSDAIESGKINLTPSVVDLVALGREMIDDYTERAMQKNLTLHFAADLPRIHVYTDQGATKQIMDNLVSNAIKYSPFDKQVFISVKHAANMALFEVKDQGPGLSAEDKRKLFQKFARLSARPTNNEHSTGLGLSIAKKLAEKMNGTIRCQSELGSGAAFIAEFPLCLDERTQSQSPS